MVSFQKMEVGASKTQVKEIVLYRGRDIFLAIRIKEQLETYVYFCRFDSKQLRKFHLLASFLMESWRQNNLLRVRWRKFEIIIAGGT